MSMSHNFKGTYIQQLHPFENISKKKKTPGCEIYNWVRNNKNGIVATARRCLIGWLTKPLTLTLKMNVKHLGKNGLKFGKFWLNQIQHLIYSTNRSASYFVV